MVQIDIMTIRYIVTLLFGVAATASFAGILQKKNTVKLACIVCFLLLLQGVFLATPHRFCEMEILNLILSHFASQADKMKAKYSFNIELPDQIPLTKPELCALVSNALENAFDAVRKLPEEKRFVEARLCVFKEKLIFSVDNSCDDKIQVTGNKPETDREEHGYGTRSIITIANEHNGMAVFQSKDGTFSLMVAIPL